MAIDWKAKARELGSNWQQAVSALKIKNLDSENDYNQIKAWMAKNPAGGSKPLSTAQKAAAQAQANQSPTVRTLGSGDQAVTYIDIPGDSAATVSSLTDAQTRSNDRLDMIFLANQASILKDKDNAIRETESANSLAAQQAVAAANKYAASQSAGATRFAATEGARAAITTQKIASESQEKQIGLQGAQDRLLAVEQGGQERLNIATRGEQERLGMVTSGEQERLNIGARGEQERLLTQEQGRQQRETDLQTEQFRRYKEAKDAAQASRAFRA